MQGSHRAAVVPLDDISTAMTRLSTTIKVATALLGFLIALAGVVVPLIRG